MNKEFVTKKLYFLCQQCSTQVWKKYHQKKLYFLCQQCSTQVWKKSHQFLLSSSLLPLSLPPSPLLHLRLGLPPLLLLEAPPQSVARRSLQRGRRKREKASEKRKGLLFALTFGLSPSERRSPFKGLLEYSKTFPRGCTNNIEYRMKNSRGQGGLGNFGSRGLAFFDMDAVHT